MADIEWPQGLVPYRVAFYLQPHVGGQESPLTRTRKVYGLSAPRWVARVTLRAGHQLPAARGYENYGPVEDDVSAWSARLDALIAQLQGGLNCVLMHDWRRPIPQYRNSSPHEWTVEAAVAGADSLTVNLRQGSPGPSIGDYIGGDGRPHIVTSVSPQGGSMMSMGSAQGAVQVQFQPPLSRPIATGHTLLTNHVTAPFRLADPDAAGQNETEVGTLSEYVLDLVEDLR